MPPLAFARLAGFLWLAAAWPVAAQSPDWTHALAGSSVATCRDRPVEVAFRLVREAGDSLYALSWPRDAVRDGELTVTVADRRGTIGWYRGLSTPMAHVGIASRDTAVTLRIGRFSMRGAACTYLPHVLPLDRTVQNVFDTVLTLLPDPRQLYLRHDTPADLYIQSVDAMPGGYAPTPLHLDAWYLSRRDGRIRKGAWWMRNRSVRWIVDEGHLEELEPNRHYVANGDVRRGREWIAEGRLPRATARALEPHHFEAPAWTDR
jgi:hypothetical protein